MVRIVCDHYHGNNTWFVEQKDLKLLLSRIEILSANIFEVLFSLLQVTMVTREATCFYFTHTESVKYPVAILESKTTNICCQCQRVCITNIHLTGSVEDFVKRTSAQQYIQGLTVY